MEIGSSFFVAGSDPTAISGSRSYQESKRGWKLVTRTVVENGVKGVRVWRVA